MPTTEGEKADTHKTISGKESNPHKYILVDHVEIEKDEIQENIGTFSISQCAVEYKTSLRFEHIERWLSCT